MEQKYGFLQDGQGHKSMGRLLALLAQGGGVITILVGLFIFVLSYGQFYGEGMAQSTALVALGIGVEVSTGALKNWAKHEEK